MLAWAQGVGALFENIGFTELLLIFVVALVIFGPQKLPSLGRSLGSALREFRKAARDITEELSRAASLDEPPAAPRPNSARPATEAKPGEAAAKSAGAPAANQAEAAAPNPAEETSATPATGGEESPLGPERKDTETPWQTV